MFDYLDLNGFKLRTVMPDGDVQSLETRYPGWLLQNLRSWTSRFNAQFRKRYGNAGPAGNSMPFGMAAPALESQGTAPPPLTLSGRPVLGCMALLVQIVAGGILGAATFRWSADNGVTWTPPPVIVGDAVVPAGNPTAATVVLTGTGLTLMMSAGTYAADNVYAADTPVPETILQWLQIVTTWDAYQKRGRDPQDPLVADLKEDRLRVLAEVDQAANSNDGRFDLPVSESADSAVTTGGPLFYSESSPFVSADRQERDGRLEDESGFGTYGGRQ